MFSLTDLDRMEVCAGRWQDSAMNASQEMREAIDELVTECRQLHDEIAEADSLSVDREIEIERLEGILTFHGIPLDFEIPVDSPEES